MGEAFPARPERLADFVVGDMGLDFWHMFITLDKRTGRPNGDLDVPCSRYGRDSRTVAYWAVAAGAVATHANGEPDNASDMFDFYMSMAVNDHEDILTMVDEYRWVLPVDLELLLDWQRAKDES